MRKLRTQRGRFMCLCHYETRTWGAWICRQIRSAIFRRSCNDLLRGKGSPRLTRVDPEIHGRPRPAKVQWAGMAWPLGPGCLTSLPILIHCSLNGAEHGRINWMTIWVICIIMEQSPPWCIASFPIMSFRPSPPRFTRTSLICQKCCKSAHSRVLGEKTAELLEWRKEIRQRVVHDKALVIHIPCIDHCQRQTPNDSHLLGATHRLYYGWLCALSPPASIIRFVFYAIWFTGGIVLV